MAEIIIHSEVVEMVTYRGVLAYVAVRTLGDGRWTTAQLAKVVSCNTSLMLEGMQELHGVAPEYVHKQDKMKWPLGSGVADGEKVQILESDSARRKDFLDDLKNSFEWANNGMPFTMNAADGRAVQAWLKENKHITRPEWKKAIYYRYMSEGIIKTQRLYLWLGRLNEYLDAPKDRFGKSMPNGIGGKHGEAIGREQGNYAARQSAVAAAAAGVQS